MNPESPKTKLGFPDGARGLAMIFAVSMAASILLYHFYYKWIDKSGIRFSERMGKFIPKRPDQE